MEILFLHQNFPGQFLHLAPALAARGHGVSALTCRAGLPAVWRGVSIHRHPWTTPVGRRTHRWLGTINAAVSRREAVFRAGIDLRDRGLAPSSPI